MALKEGSEFAGYRVIRQLGSGGMGDVYLVQHPRLPRREALKVLRSDVSSDPSFRERFVREADLASGLRHPHIVGIHDRGEHDGQLWIAMDYVDGTDVARLLGLKYPAGLPVDVALPVITAVASALDYAHRKGLLHRDVKPANIIVGDLDSLEPSVSLADFGIARPLNEISGITTTNMTLGTVAYAAPEQLLGDPMDGRADQYALAATTYHMLTGVVPFENSNPAAVIGQHLNASPPPLSRVRNELHGLDPVLAVALAKEPGRRFSTCLDFAHALEGAWKPNSSASASKPTAAAPVPKQMTFPITEASRARRSTRRMSTNHPSPPMAVYEPKPRRSMIVSTVAGVVLLTLVAVAFVARPWPHERLPDETAHSSYQTEQPPYRPDQPPPAASDWSRAPTPERSSPPLPDTDDQGFLHYPGARCNYINPAVAIARTEKSLVVICQTGVGRYYYRGYGLVNGKSIEIDDPKRNGSGFIASNNGVQYLLDSQALTITEGSEVLSHEPILAYWTSEAATSFRTQSGFFRTQSGKVRCFVSASESQRGGAPAAVCETYADETDGAFPQGPLVECGPGCRTRANIAGVDDKGELRWNSGDIPGANREEDVVMQYGHTYRANGWTIEANSDGTRLTNDATGHGMFVSIQNVYAF